MKKRTIKQQAKDAEQKILERNSDFYDEIMLKHYGKKPKKAKSKRNFKLLPIWIGTTLPLAAALVLCLVFLLPSPGQTPGKNYLQENAVSIDSSLEEVNASLSGIVLNIDSSYAAAARKCYDSQYNDTLYYIVDLTKMGETIEIYLYVNPDFKRRKELYDTSIPFETDEFAGNYNKTATNNGGVYTLNYTAVTNYNGVGIYIAYTEMALDETGNFFSFFEQTIKKA